MNIGIIGTGGRSLAYLEILRPLEGHSIKGICDLDRKRLDEYGRVNLPDLPHDRMFVDYRELINDTVIDVVLICTPDTTHREIALASAAAGKSILLEKPIATTLEDTQALYAGLHQYDKPVYLGFVLRYAPFFTKLKEVIDTGVIGEIVTVQASEMLDTRHAASFFRRWHRFSRNNGGLMNAKCSHDLDLLNWIIGSDPVEVSAFGGRRIFVPKSDAAMNCHSCALRNECLYVFPTEYYQTNFGSFHALSDLCVYNSEKDIVDHECMLIKYANGSVVQFELSLFSHEENRTMTIHGSKAVLKADFLHNIVTVQPLRGGEYSYTAEGLLGGHGGGDSALLTALLADAEAQRPVNHIRSGSLATLTALAGESSMKTGQVIDLSSKPWRLDCRYE